MTPLHLAASALAAGVPPSVWVSGVLAPRVAWRTRHQAMGSRPDEPQYPAPGAIIDYFIAEKAALTGRPAVLIEILDAGGQVVRSFVPDPGTTVGGAMAAATARRRGDAPVRLSTSPGLHRIVWDLRHQGPADARGAGRGPLVVPGKYMVRFTAGDTIETKAFEVRLDPRVAADGVTQADLEEQFRLLVRIQETAARARDLAARATAALDRLSAAGDTRGVEAIRSILSQLVTAGGPYPQPMLIDQLSGLARMADSADMRVGRSTLEYLEELAARLAALEADLPRAPGN